MNTQNPSDFTLKPESSDAPARVIAVASGKGGVGKTNVVTNLGIAVAARGRRVCIVDADAGMANVNILLGFSPKHGLAEVLNGEIGLDEALFKGPHGVQVLAGASGLAGMASLDAAQRQRLLGVVEQLEQRLDVIFVDLAAGADATVIDMLRAAHHRLVVVTPDPTSLTNAYSLLKILENTEAGLGVGVVVNQATSEDNGEATYQRLKKVCDLFLKNTMRYLGHVCTDPTITTSVRLRRPVVLLKHDAPASHCFYRLAQTFIDLIAAPLADEQRFSAQWEPEAAGEPEALPPPALPESPRAAAPSPALEEPAAAPVAGPPPPVPPQAAAGDAMTAPPPDRKALLERLTQEMSGGEISEHEAGMIVLSLLSACLNGFGRYPVDIRALVNAAINRRELSADALRHLASQLQQTYRDRFGHELYPVDTPPSHLTANR